MDMTWLDEKGCRLKGIIMSLGVHINRGTWDLVRHLNAGELALYSSMEKLSSGLKINRASDGPTVLVVSERLRAQIASLNQEVENLYNQGHQYEYASSTAMQLRSNLSDLQLVAVGASNEALNDEAMQAAYDSTAQNIVASYNHIVRTATYNGKPLFDGSEAALASVSALEGIDFSSPEAVAGSMEVIEQATRELDQVQIELGAMQKNQIDSQRASLETTKQNLVAAESRLRDADFVMEYTNFLAESVRMRMGVALLAHSRINAEAVLSMLDS